MEKSNYIINKSSLSLSAANDNKIIKSDRKTIEKNRRIQMKALIHHLTSLVPPHHFNPSKEMLAQRDQVDQVAEYIKKMREKIENLEKKKQELIITINNNNNNVIRRRVGSMEIKVPFVKVSDVGSSLLEVVIIYEKETNKKYYKLGLHEIVRVIEEQGLDVITANVSTVGFHVYHILHAKVKVLRLGVDTSMIYDKFQPLISEFDSE